MDALIAAFARDALGVANRKGYLHVDRKSQAFSMLFCQNPPQIPRYSP
jgi:hypothetical protein